MSNIKTTGQRYGGRKGMELGQLREVVILAWLARWRYSTASILRIVLNRDDSITLASTGEKLNKMMHKNLITKSSALNRGGYVYRLTEQGRKEYARLSDRDIPAKMDASKIMANHMVPHNLGASLVVARLYSEKRIARFETQFELRQSHANEEQFLERGTVPDAVVIYKSGERVAIEFEPSQKSELKLLGRYKDLSNDDIKDKVGVLLEHDWVMDRGQENQNLYWTRVLYCQMTEQVRNTYQKHIKTFYKRYATNGDDEWRAKLCKKFEHSVHFAEEINETIYQKVMKPAKYDGLL